MTTKLTNVCNRNRNHKHKHEMQRIRTCKYLEDMGVTDTGVTDTGGTDTKEGRLQAGWQRQAGRQAGRQASRQAGDENGRCHAHETCAPAINKSMTNLWIYDRGVDGSQRNTGVRGGGHTLGGVHYPYYQLTTAPIESGSTESTTAMLT